MGFDLTKEDINIVQERTLNSNDFFHIDDWTLDIPIDASFPQPGTYPGSILTEWNVEKLNNNGIYEAVNFVTPDGFQAVGEASYSRGPDGRVYQQLSLLQLESGFLMRDTFFGRMTPEEIVQWDTFLFMTPSIPAWLQQKNFHPQQFAEWRERNVGFNVIERSLITQEILAYWWGRDRTNVLLEADLDIPYNWDPYAVARPEGMPSPT